jgi:ABC-type multidrug transport system ATPase subunit
MLTVRELRLALGDFQLHAPALDLEPGQAVWLRGANGAGKSTLLKCLAGIFRPTADQLLCADSALLRSPVRYKQRVVYASARCHGYPDYDTGATLGFCRRFYPRWRDAQASQLLAALQLPAGRRLERFSTGMLAKLSMTIALSSGADVLLLDETLAPVDEASREVVRDTVRGALQHGAALVYCSHHQDLLSALCTRHWQAVDGRVSAAAPGAQVAA